HAVHLRSLFHYTPPCLPLSLHELTDEIPTRSDIAIPRGTQPVTVHNAPIAWHRFDPDTFRIGRTERALPGGVAIGIYSAERVGRSEEHTSELQSRVALEG